MRSPLPSTLMPTVNCDCTKVAFLRCRVGLKPSKRSPKGPWVMHRMQQYPAILQRLGGLWIGIGNAWGKAAWCGAVWLLRLGLRIAVVGDGLGLRLLAEDGGAHHRIELVDIGESLNFALVVDHGGKIRRMHRHM